MKRIVSLLVSLMVLFSFTAAFADTVPLAEKVQGTSKIEKITDEPVTISIWIDFAPTDISNLVDDIQKIDLITTLEEKTGVDIELVCAPVGEGQNNFSLILTNRNKMPDIILGFDSFYAKGGDAAIEEGIIYDLKDLVAEYAPHYEAARTATPYRALNTMTDEGHMPYICQFTFNDELAMTYGGPIIRQDLLDKLGMDMPTTFDDWHDYLKRSKDELGMTRALGFSYNGVSKYNAFNAAFDFGMSDSAQGGDFFIKDGKVSYGPLDHGYVDYIHMMNSWYEEGLIDPDFTSTITFDDGIAMLSGNLCAGSSDHSGLVGYINILGTAVDPEFNFVAAPYPVLEEGQTLHYGYVKGGPALINSAAITTNCKHPEIAVKLLDQLFTDEGFMLCNYGTEGKTYNLVDGVPVFTDLIANNDKGTAAHMLAAYAATAHIPFEYVLGHADEAGLDSSAIVWDTNNDYAYSFPNGVTLNTSEKEIYAKYFADITTYVEEMTVQFIMGLEDIDECYDAFVETLVNELHANEVLDAYQAAYERYLNRK